MDLHIFINLKYSTIIFNLTQLLKWYLKFVKNKINKYKFVKILNYKNYKQIKKRIEFY